MNIIIVFNIIIITVVIEIKMFIIITIIIDSLAFSSSLVLTDQ